MGADGFTIDVVPLQTVGAIDGWDRLVGGAEYPIFYSSRFLTCVATTPLLEAEFAELVLMHDGDGIAAAMPVFGQRGSDPLKTLSPLNDTFPGLSTGSNMLGHCWHCYDSRIIVVRAGAPVDRMVAALEARAREARADYFGLVNVSDPLTLQSMAESGMAPHYMTDRFVMDISGFSSFEAYLAALLPDCRRELRRQFKHYAASAAELVVEEAPFANLDEVVQLLRWTAARYDTEFYYPHDATRHLLGALGDRLRLVSIRVGGERIGVVVCFFEPPRFHIWAAGMRYDRTAFSPYAIGMVEAIRYAIERRFSLIEGGRGNGRIKKKQGFVPRRLHACLRRTGP